MRSGTNQVYPSSDPSTSDVQKNKIMQQKALRIIHIYLDSLSCLNLYGKKRAEQLAVKIRNTQAAQQPLINIMADFIRTGKTECDNSVLSFFRSPSRCSGVSRDSLRGMFIDHFLGKPYFANASESTRIPNIYSLLKNTVKEIADRIRTDWFSISSKADVDARRAGQSLR
jgi:hypothetical protein